MKKVLILFGKASPQRELPFLASEEKYQKCYEILYKMAAQEGIFLCRASYEWFDHEKNSFSLAWTFQNGKWKKICNVKPDLIYDKSKFNFEIHLFKEKLKKNIPIVNDPDFTLLLADKLYANVIFPKFFKQYYKVTSRKELMRYINKIPTKTVVLKPAVGSGGDDIKILEKKKLGRIKIDKPYLIQEFLDTSSGIKNIASGMHDLRLVCINDDLIYSYIRQPAPGSFLANIAQGGSMFIVQRDKLPKSALELLETVQDRLKVFSPRVFTVDVMFDKSQRPWIVEMNSMPGLYFQPSEKRQMMRMYKGLIRIFKQHK